MTFNGEVLYIEGNKHTIAGDEYRGGGGGLLELVEESLKSSLKSP